MIKQLKKKFKPLTIESYVICSCYTITDCTMACGTNMQELGGHVAVNGSMAASLAQYYN